MPDVERVVFGISNLHVCTYMVDDEGQVILGTPYHQKGAVGFTPEESQDQTRFFADNILYWDEYSGGNFSGDLEVAKFDKDYKKNFLGYVELDDGGLTRLKKAGRPHVCVMFQVETDIDPIRVIFYNCTQGNIQREYHTIEENREPVTETIPISVLGDEATGISKVVYEYGKAGYDSLFSNPPIPTLPNEESES